MYQEYHLLVGKCLINMFFLTEIVEAPLTQECRIWQSQMNDQHL